ncbi:MAG TPA: DUF3147 family protein [Terriglobales bacterium]|jgi:hypothetical protein|nr:DUF3147 family protein [Terriglobales bacterium]
MRPQIDLKTLELTKWHEYLIRFVFGGCVTVLAGLVAREFGPVVGGLFLAFPAIFPASATLIEKHETEKCGTESYRREVGKIKAGFDAEGAALGSVGLAVFGWMVWKFLPEYSTGAVFASAFIAWLIVATALWGVRVALHRPEH